MLQPELEREQKHTKRVDTAQLAIAIIAVLAVIGIATYFIVKFFRDKNAPEKQNAYGSGPVKGYQPPVQATPQRVDYAQPEGNTSMHFTRDGLGNIRFRPTGPQPTGSAPEAQKGLSANAKYEDAPPGVDRRSHDAPPGVSSSDLAKPGYDLTGLRTQGDANLAQPAKSVQRRSLVLRAREYACFRAASASATSASTDDNLFHTHLGGLMMWVYLPKARGAAVLASLGNIATGRQAFCLKYAHGEGLCASLYDQDGDEVAKVKAPKVDLMDNAWHLVGFMLDAPAGGSAANTSGLRLYNDGMEVAADPFADAAIVGAKATANALCINRAIGAKALSGSAVPVMYVSNLTFWRKPLGPIPVSSYYANGQEELLDPADIVTDPAALGAWWKLSDREGSQLPVSAVAPGFQPVPGKVLSRTQAGRAAGAGAPSGRAAGVQAPSSEQIDNHAPRDIVYAKQWAVVAFAKGQPATTTTATPRSAKNAHARENPSLVDYLRPHPTLIAQQTRESTLMSENMAAKRPTAKGAAPTEIVVNVDTQPKHNNDRLDRDAWKPGDIAVQAPQSFVY